MTEPTKRARAKLTDLWEKVSQHPLWAAVLAALIAAAIIAHAGGLFTPAAQTTPPSIAAVRHPPVTKSPLRVAFTPVAPPLFATAFARTIGVPSSSEGWEALHHRGGIDVGESDFRLTLANRSAAPLTITNLEAIVRSATPAPVATLAAMFTQGAAQIEEFSAELANATVGAHSPLHRERSDEGSMDPNTSPRFFTNHIIALKPGEIYEAKLAVISHVHRDLGYRWLIAGNSAAGGFSEESSTTFHIAGTQSAHKYAREYWLIPKPRESFCWIAAHKFGSDLPVCPGARSE